MHTAAAIRELVDNMVPGEIGRSTCIRAVAASQSTAISTEQ